MEVSSGKAGIRTQGRLGRDIQAKIGSQLRAMYDEVVQEGVPDRFAELLGRLDANEDVGNSEKERKGEGSNDKDPHV